MLDQGKEINIPSQYLPAVITQHSPTGTSALIIIMQNVPSAHIWGIVSEAYHCEPLHKHDLAQECLFTRYCTTVACLPPIRGLEKCRLYDIIVRELTFETLPPPPWGISETYISKNLIPSAVQISLSALISRVRLPWRAN